MSWWRQLLGRLQLRWRGGLPLRYTMVAVVVLGVTTPAVVFFAVEQRLAERSQNELIERSESAFVAISRVSVADAMWALDRSAVDAALNRILDNPQVVAVRVNDALAGTAELERIRPGFTQSLQDEADAQRLRRFQQPIERNGEKLGVITVWFDLAYGDSLLTQRRFEMLMLVALQVLASLVVLMPMLVNRVLKPVERLKSQATALLQRSPEMVNTDFVWRRNDELGLLGRHLGQVQSQLRELFSQLQSKNEQLQQLALYDHLT